MKQPSSATQGGFSIIEGAIACAVIAIALSSLFSFNSSCLGLVRNAKDSSEAMLSNQERVEQLRSCNWSSITSKDYLKDSVMNAATQTGKALSNATEIVRITENGYVQGGSAAYFEVTRTPGGTSITATNSDASLLTARMLQVDVTLNWTTLGGRARTRASSCFIARGGLTINETTTIAPSVTW